MKMRVLILSLLFTLAFSAPEDALDGDLTDTSPEDDAANVKGYAWTGDLLNTDDTETLDDEPYEVENDDGTGDILEYVDTADGGTQSDDQDADTQHTICCTAGMIYRCGRRGTTFYRILGRLFGAKANTRFNCGGRKPIGCQCFRSRIYRFCTSRDKGYRIRIKWGDGHVDWSRVLRNPPTSYIRRHIYPRRGNFRNAQIAIFKTTSGSKVCSFGSAINFPLIHV